KRVVRPSAGGERGRGRHARPRRRRHPHQPSFVPDRPDGAARRARSAHPGGKPRHAAWLTSIAAFSLAPRAPADSISCIGIIPPGILKGTTMRTAIALALAAFALSPLAPAGVAYAATEQAPVAENERLHQWFEVKFEEMLQFSPLWMTQLGRKDLYGEIDDFSIEGEDKQLAWYKATVEELEREFDYDSLSPSDRLAYDLWKYEYESSAESAK